MSVQKIKVEENEVELVNTSENPEKITRIKADDEYEASKNSFESMFENNPHLKNNPMEKMMGNIEEIKKIKPYFFFSIVCGLIALFALREYLGVAAIFLGILDLLKGSSFTKTASYFGIFLGLTALVIEFS